MKLFLAWFVVGIPLAWGVMASVEKSLPLFSPPAAAVAPK